MQTQLHTFVPRSYSRPLTTSEVVRRSALALVVLLVVVAGVLAWRHLTAELGDGVIAAILIVVSAISVVGPAAAVART